MTIQLYKNLSDNRYVVKQLSEILSAEILLLEDDSTDAPIVVLTMFETYNAPNYAYIAEFNKYYYINNTEVLTGGRVRYTMKCDVLMTFADGIKSSVALIKRANSVGNILMNDEGQAIRADEILTNLAFSGGELIKNGVSYLNYSFLLNAFGGR